jgi:hypothetical protein
MTSAERLRAVEALARNSHELMGDAAEQAADGGDAVLQRRLSVLAGLIHKELANIRALIASRTRKEAG